MTNLAMRLGIIQMTSANGMTPQQIRLFHLQAGRNWGPFTQAQYDNLNSQKKRGRPEAFAPDVSALVRVLNKDEILEDLKTVQMPGE